MFDNHTVHEHKDTKRFIRRVAESSEAALQVN